MADATDGCGSAGSDAHGCPLKEAHAAACPAAPPPVDPRQGRYHRSSPPDLWLTALVSTHGDAHRRAHGDQEQRAPGRAHARGRARTGAAGHAVTVQSGAGLGIGADDDVYAARGADIAPSAAEVFGSCELIVKVKEPQESERRQLRPVPDPVRLPPPRAGPAADGRAVRERRDRDRVRDRHRSGRHAPAAGPHVADRGPPVGPVRRLRPRGSQRRSRRAPQRGARGAAGPCRRPRRRRGGRERHPHRRRHGGPCRRPRPVVRGARSARPPLRHHHHHGVLVALDHRPCGRGGRRGHRRGAGEGRSCADARRPPAPRHDAPGLGARRRVHRPGRLLRDLTADHLRRPDLRGRRHPPLLRGQHAGRRAPHLHLRC